MINEVYDKIYIGSGPILLLDAVNESLKGSKILIIDKSERIGGAWKNIDIFGLRGLENAVHYLIPSKKSYKFLEEIMDIELSKKGADKYYARNYFGISMLFRTNSFLGRFINLIEKNKFSIKYIFGNYFIHCTH